MHSSLVRGRRFIEWGVGIGLLLACGTVRAHSGWVVEPCSAVCDGDDDHDRDGWSGARTHCDDGNPCTIDICDPGLGCMHTPVEDGTSCSDGNRCNGAETCAAGTCTRGPAPDCDDHDPCTVDSCDCSGGCVHKPAKDGRSCSDGDVCNGAETCRGGTCMRGTEPSCHDDDPCTADACDPIGGCMHTPIAGCSVCRTDDDCSDGNGCTTDACDLSHACEAATGTCTHTTIEACVPCATAAQCDDENPCTTDVCNASAVCEHVTKADCIPCSSEETCRDENACTTEACSMDGSCQQTFAPGCVACTGVEGCDDHDGCTTDACTDGVCTHTRGADCCTPTTEVCGDGIDNDCDGLVDCDDPNCSAAPSCQPGVEICGNCVDDDGNGLTDFEDPACCSSLRTFAMTLSKGRIVPQGETSSLRLRSGLAETGLGAVNPMQEDVFVQIRPGGATDMFCAKVPAEKFMRMHRKFMFWDHSGRLETAKGLTDMTITVKRSGKVGFRTHGRRAKLKAPAEGPLEVTVGFRNPKGSDAENRCSRTLQAFRAGREGKLSAP